MRITTYDHDIVNVMQLVTKFNRREIDKAQLISGLNIIGVDFNLNRLKDGRYINLIPLAAMSTVTAFTVRQHKHI